MEVSSRTDSFGELRATPARKTATCELGRLQCWINRGSHVSQLPYGCWNSHSKRGAESRCAANNINVPTCIQLQLLAECVGRIISMIAPQPLQLRDKRLQQCRLATGGIHIER
eukprot:COSAG02_NODE_79_length_40228_cov_18.435762_7_plen_113_part_00